jgi:hypothetical protein
LLRLSALCHCTDCCTSQLCHRRTFTSPGECASWQSVCGCCTAESSCERQVHFVRTSAARCGVTVRSAPRHAICRAVRVRRRQICSCCLSEFSVQHTTGQHSQSAFQPRLLQCWPVPVEPPRRGIVCQGICVGQHLECRLSSLCLSLQLLQSHRSVEKLTCMVAAVVRRCVLANVSSKCPHEKPFLTCRLSTPCSHCVVQLDSISHRGPGLQHCSRPCRV